MISILEKNIWVHMIRIYLFQLLFLFLYIYQKEGKLQVTGVQATGLWTQTKGKWKYTNKRLTEAIWLHV